MRGSFPRSVVPCAHACLSIVFILRGSDQLKLELKLVVSYCECWERLPRDKAFSCCLALRLLSCFESVSQITWRKLKQRFNKERFQLAEILRSARCSGEKVDNCSCSQK